MPHFRLVGKCRDEEFSHETTDRSGSSNMASALPFNFSTMLTGGKYCSLKYHASEFNAHPQMILY